MIRNFKPDIKEVELKIPDWCKFSPRMEKEKTFKIQGTIHSLEKITKDGEHEFVRVLLNGSQYFVEPLCKSLTIICARLQVKHDKKHLEPRYDKRNMIYECS